MLRAAVPAAPAINPRVTVSIAARYPRARSHILPRPGDAEGRCSMATILVTGGTGTLGRVVVRQLLGAGCAVTVASRRHRPAEPTPFRWATVDYGDAGTLDRGTRIGRGQHPADR